VCCAAKATGAGTFELHLAGVNDEPPVAESGSHATSLAVGESAAVNLGSEP